MNPWAGLIIVVAVLFFIVAWKGTQDNVLTAILNRPYGSATVGGAPKYTPGFSSFSPSTTPAAPTFQGQPVLSA